jgi:hypothetical protein
MKNFTLSSKILNFDNEDTRLVIGLSARILNFDNEDTRLFINISNKILNYELMGYDQGSVIYGILLDFLETFSVGDIFNA